MKTISTSIAAIAIAVTQVQGHGRMISPPHRGYIGKLPKFNYIPVDYSDNGLNAGGIPETSGGQHGVCGDPYSGPREHETGGTYGLFPKLGERAIGACYAPGSVIDIEIQITANHKGYFVFGLCPLSGKNAKESETCFQDLVQTNGEKQWQLPVGNEYFKMQYKLPSGITCEGDDHCVLRWWYVGGNNPGVGINGQEQFWNCADIYISNTCGQAKPSTLPSSLPSTSPVVRPSTSPTSKPGYTKKPTPSPYNPSPNPSAPSNDKCGSCNNCYYATTKACFNGWTSDQCSQSGYQWCGNAATDDAPKYTSRPKSHSKRQHSGKQKPLSSKKTWEQCGGKDYTGNTTCQEQDECVIVDEWYAQCQPKA